MDDESETEVTSFNLAISESSAAEDDPDDEQSDRGGRSFLVGHSDHDQPGGGSGHAEPTDQDDRSLRDEQAGGSQSEVGQAEVGQADGPEEPASDRDHRTGPARPLNPLAVHPSAEAPSVSALREEIALIEAGGPRAAGGGDAGSQAGRRPLPRGSANADIGPDSRDNRVANPGGTRGRSRAGDDGVRSGDRTRRRADRRHGSPGRRREPDAERDLGAPADPESVARTIVLTKLTAQARTRQELRTALDRKDVPAEVSERVLDRMTEVGLVDDAAFAEAWVTSRQSRRQLSSRALRQELVRKGVEREQIETALEQIQPEDEYDAALELAQKKGRSTAGLDRQVRYRRLVGALARKGFSSDITRRVIAEVLDGHDPEPLG